MAHATYSISLESDFGSFFAHTADFLTPQTSPTHCRISNPYQIIHLIARLTSEGTWYACAELLRMPCPFLVEQSHPLSHKGPQCVPKSIHCISFVCPHFIIILIQSRCGCLSFVHDVELYSISCTAALAYRCPVLPGCLSSQESLFQWVAQVPWPCAGFSDRLVALF